MWTLTPQDEMHVCTLLAAVLVLGNVEFGPNAADRASITNLATVHHGTVTLPLRLSPQCFIVVRVHTYVRTHTHTCTQTLTYSLTYFMVLFLRTLPFIAISHSLTAQSQRC